MIKLVDLLIEITTYSDKPNTWVHVTSKDETIEKIKGTGKFLGIDENLDEFEYEVQKGLKINKNNPNSPNFYKDEIYPVGVPNDIKYVIVFSTDKKYPGDDAEYQNWKEVDYPVIPNGNRVNRLSFKQSSKIGILKPKYRDKKFFKFYQYNPENKKHEEFNIENWKSK